MTLHNANSRKNRNSRKNNRSRNLLEQFEPRVLLTAAAGSVDLLTRTQIVGWARDADTPNSKVNVVLKVDGVASNTIAQSSFAAYNGTIAAGHGFSFNLPALGPGVHTVTVTAADTKTGAPTLLKSTTITNPAPIGNVEVINGTTVSGWAFDKDAGVNPIQVRVDNDGSIGTPVSALNNRPDLTAYPPVKSPNHGFSVSGSFNGVVDVWALDNPTSTPVLLKTTSVKATGHLDILKLNRIAGWAFTPDMGATPMDIQVFVDGVLFQTGSTGTSRPELAARNGGNANTGFDFTLNGVAPGKHNIQVFAIDTKTTSSNNKVLIGSGVLVNSNPLGMIDVVNSNGIAGWVSDPDAGATSIKYTVKVDNATVISAATASSARPGLTSYKPVGSPNHGFLIAFPSTLSAGPHKIELFALDAPSGQEVLIKTQFINNTLPFGFLDSTNAAVTGGWAYDPDSPGTPVQVVLEVDGVRDVQHAANQVRNGLLSLLPDAAHAFSIQTPTELAGTHVVKAIAIDTFSGQEVVLGVKKFTNRAPRGAILAASSTGVVGWAQDLDTPSAKLNVLVSIDGVVAPSSVGTANLATSAALTAAIGSANHGFAISYPKLSKGAHVIQVFAVDSLTVVSSLIGTKNIMV